MKKNSLSAAVVAGLTGVAGLAGVANAVNLNPDGVGQVLLYPYYTVNANNVTILSVVNTTSNAKAVKVRFLESLNSAEVLDFNLYLSPFDVWTAAVSASGDGAAISTDDNSCTVPSVQENQPVAFRTFQFNTVAGARDILRFVFSATQALNRTRQGHVELIEMGDLTNEGDGLFNPAFYATHNAATNGNPFDCQALEDAWAQGGEWLESNGGRAVNAGTGGLFGGGAIVSVDRGRVLSYNAEAIDGFYFRDPNVAGDTEVFSGFTTTLDLHEEPGTVFPNFNQARTDAGGVVANIFDQGRLVPIRFTGVNAGRDAVSAALMARRVFNEYNLETATGASSEWVITYPTKRLHIHPLLASSIDPATDPRPFSDRSDGDAGSDFEDGLVFDTNGSCDSIEFRFWNREERTTTTGVDFSPRPTTPGQALCWEANVFAFNQTISATAGSRILGANSAQGARGVSGISFQSGWARVEFDNPNSNGFQNYLSSGVHATSGDRIGVVGLPVIGFWAADNLNENVTAGVRANYGQIHRHRVERDGVNLTDAGIANPAAGTALSQASAGTWTNS